MRVTVLPMPQVGQGLGVGAGELGGVVDGPHADDGRLALHQAGTDWTVPTVPGLVMVMEVPAKSSGESLFSVTLPMTSYRR